MLEENKNSDNLNEGRTPSKSSPKKKKKPSILKMVFIIMAIFILCSFIANILLLRRINKLERRINGLAQYTININI